LQVGKAWREMIHRYAATTLGLIILVIAFLSLRWRRHPGVKVALPLMLVALVIFQGLLGMLTVTWLLKPLIVTAHLVCGLATLSLLWWLWLTLRRQSSGADGIIFSRGSGSASALFRPAPQRLRTIAAIALLALTVQILLGGWTSTNYAATACPDFPKCQASWWPQADFINAFVPWHGLGINYEGGILSHVARVAIHFTHRLGAVIATLALLYAGIVTFRRRQDIQSRWAAAAVLIALALQLLIGITMVLRGFPLWIATAHNAGAALLLLATLGLNRALRRS
jgi:cytochrome c oxidase assembly protein subunit 15